MNQAFTSVRTFVVSALLLTAVASAPAGASNTKSTEHHSKFSKVAFWRHHNDSKKNAKQDAAKHTTSKPAPKKAEVKPAAVKQSQASKTRVKPVSAKSAKADQKQESLK